MATNEITPKLKMVCSGAIEKIVGEDIVLFDIQDKKVIIDTFEFTINGSANGTYPALHISGYASSNAYDGQIFHSLNSTGGGTRFIPTPQRIAGDGSSYFEIMEYNPVAHEYKFSLKMPIELPQGGRLSFKSYTSHQGGDKVQYKCVYRVWE